MQILLFVQVEIVHIVLLFSVWCVTFLRFLGGVHQKKESRLRDEYLQLDAPTSI